MHSNTLKSNRKIFRHGMLRWRKETIQEMSICSRKSIVGIFPDSIPMSFRLNKSFSNQRFILDLPRSIVSFIRFHQIMSEF